jgi:hypothetical protein
MQAVYLMSRGESTKYAGIRVISDNQMPFPLLNRTA